MSAVAVERGTLEQLSQAKQESKSVVGCIRAAWRILARTLCCGLCLPLLFILPIAQIMMGASFYWDCFGEKWIPRYMVVCGGNILLALILIAAGTGCALCDPEAEGDNCVKCSKGPVMVGQYIVLMLVALIVLFLFGWTIAGQVWVYRLYNRLDSVNSLSGEYCNPRLYFFAFWLLNVLYITIAFVVIAGIVYAVYNAVRNRKS